MKLIEFNKDAGFMWVWRILFSWSDSYFRVCYYGGKYSNKTRILLFWNKKHANHTN